MPNSKPLGPSDDPIAPVLDVVVPVFNEERDLEPNVRRLHGHLSETFPYPFRITVADNASTDDTPHAAARLAAELPFMEWLRLPEKGRGRALRAAWSRSPAPVLAYVDVDLSTELTALLPLVAPLISGHSDIAIGTRLAPASRVVRGPKREVTSRCYNALLRSTLAVGFSDAQCGFKAIRRDVAAALLPLVEDTGWFFDTELLVIAERSGLRIHEIPVDWTDDPDSRVDILPTALADLRGIARLSRALARGTLSPGALRLATDAAGALTGAGAGVEGVQLAGVQAGPGVQLTGTQHGPAAQFTEAQPAPIAQLSLAQPASSARHTHARPEPTTQRPKAQPGPPAQLPPAQPEPTTQLPRPQPGPPAHLPPAQPAPRTHLPPPHSTRTPITPTAQLARFAAIGAMSTVGHLLLYAALSPALGAQVANAVALLLCALGNTAANRRLTFGYRGRGGVVRHHGRGLVVFLVGLALTSGSLAALHHAAPSAGHGVDLVVLLAANLTATVLRFLLLRAWVFRA